ncbi:MAG TPA: UDP-N-acetylglucosamine 2-epimerase (non-hydrolyzing) [Panacibacter sp.]|mgnify:CR=1 FL=1|nr:UDP-N-acetylglucosamine 2-epimerase (non-hydrolyzing) [Panacibacter sp.]HNP46700.1 UDP-N-acetylglucosamine 2-epimerase (non-hydrolyzing) [Panacibacter sp.]
MKVLTIIGARPQFVKASVVSMALKKQGIEEIIIHTGQHYDEKMSEIFFTEMNIPKPAYNLQIGNLSHGAMTGRMIEKIEALITELKPDYLMVYGDTNSTMAGAIAASKTKVKMVHIEAGLRSFNMNMPEEVNRIVTDRLSDILFCPTTTAIQNLKLEGFDHFTTKQKKKIRVELIGDVMKDAAEYFSGFAEEKSTGPVKEIVKQPFALCTLHRAENLGDLGRLQHIFDALNEISQQLKIVLPMHPGTKKTVEQGNIQIAAGIEVMEPVGFFDMLTLLKHTTCVFTDSGGLQKEAYFSKKPCITLRDETEWVELVEHGYNKLAGADKDLILQAFAAIDTMDLANAKPLYGEGFVSDSIAAILKEDYEGK